MSGKVIVSYLLQLYFNNCYDVRIMMIVYVSVKNSTVYIIASLCTKLEVCSITR